MTIVLFIVTLFALLTSASSLIRVLTLDSMFLAIATINGVSPFYFKHNNYIQRMIIVMPYDPMNQQWPLFQLIV